MTEKNEQEVLIDGKVITLSGNEETEYLQKVAAYVNSKITEIKKAPDFAYMSTDMKTIMIALNISDDYFKGKSTNKILEEDLSSKDKEIYNLKHELISYQMTIDGLNDEIAELKKQVEQLQQNGPKMEGKNGTKH